MFEPSRAVGEYVSRLQALSQSLATSRTPAEQLQVLREELQILEAVSRSSPLPARRFRPPVHDE